MAQDPLAPIGVVATNSLFCDPAIAVPRDERGNYMPGEDDEADRMIEEYRDTRDRSVLKFRDGAQPVVFNINPISAQYVRVNLGSIAESVRPWYAFRASLENIQLPTGARIENGIVGKARKGEVLLVPDSVMEQIARRFAIDTIDEIGQVAMDRARLPEGARGPFSYRVGSGRRI